MIKTRKNIFFIFSISLVLLVWTSIYNNSHELINLAEQTTEMQTPNSSSGCFSAQNDVCEDEQMHKVFAEWLFVEPVVLISNSVITDIVFQPCVVPWEPPKK